jgi:hypothetical protein
LLLDNNLNKGQGHVKVKEENADLQTLILMTSPPTHTKKTQQKNKHAFQIL